MVVIGLAAILIFVFGFVVMKNRKQDGYRMMQVYQIKGKATIERENVGTMDAYENLNLISGDKVEVAQDSYMRLKVDGDKYILAEAGSIFHIYATGKENSGKTDIQLEQGAVTVEVQNKLSDSASFEVTTPNSVMAVRGTVFRINAEKNENGDTVITITVLEGFVSVQKREEDGKLSDEQIVGSGKEAIVYKDTDLQNLQMKMVDEISTTDIPVEVWEFLQEIVMNGRELSITDKEIKALIEQLSEGEVGENIEENPEENTEENTEENNENITYTVTFIYQGEVFATQMVEAGEKVSEPTLRPAPEGRWNFDFSEAVYEDTRIEFTE